MNNPLGVSCLSDLGGGGVLPFIIQQIVTLSKYGHDALDICHP